MKAHRFAPLFALSDAATPEGVVACLTVEGFGPTVPARLYSLLVAYRHLRHDTRLAAARRYLSDRALEVTPPRRRVGA